MTPRLAARPVRDDALVAGVDEVGRGPLAGPVVAAAVILIGPVEGLADSKRLTPRQRELLVPLVQANGLIGIGAASVREIDRLNILQASLLAMRRAILRLPTRPRALLVDGRQRPPIEIPATCIPGGDASEPAIAAASIVAKVLRDRLMTRLAARHDGYGFDHNAGYPTREHHRALRLLGPTPHHRRSFAPIAALLAREAEKG